MLEVVGVDVGEAGRERLQRCSLSVRPGEVLGVVGPTGAGKSTLLEVMAGRRTPIRGRLTWEGRDVTRSPDRLRAIASLCPDELPGPSGLAALDWLRLHLELEGVPSAQLGEGPAALRRFELEPLAARPVETLSRGMRRRLDWARASLRRPRVLLLDGPGDGVDGAALRLLAAWLKEASAGGTAVVLTATAPHVPTTLCDRVAVLQRGAVGQVFVRGEAAFAAGVAAALGWSS
ncbi:ABC transporter ATP-binding protein [Myxococcota bacterium]|nr:ABC transporter ATP-binding protein [Myxococcota bacterium]